MQFNRRKIIKALEFFITLLVTCLFIFALFLSLKNTLKPSVNDSDLAITHQEVSTESNAYWTLLKATNELYWPGMLETKIKDLANDTNWDSSLADNVLEKNRAALNLFNEAMQQPSLLVPEPTNTFDEDFPYLSGWKQLSYVELIQINSLHHIKKDKEAFDLSLKLINFGQQAENSGGPVFHYLVGAAIKHLGLICIQRTITDTTLNETNLAQVIYALNRLGPNPEGFSNTIKMEYKLQCNFVTDVEVGNISGMTNSGFEKFIGTLVLKPLFSAKETRKEFAQADRAILGNFPKPLSQMPWTNISSINTNISRWDLLASGNAMGSTFYDLEKTAINILPSRKDSEDVEVKATQILLALKIYQMRHGKLPDSLSELTPEFFPQIPKDDFDGKPFRYLPNKKIIYSVGPCLKDLGGKARVGHSDDYNLPFKIEF
jgi:hypothetical protein